MLTNFIIDKVILKELKIILTKEDITVSQFLRKCINEKIKNSKTK